MCPVNNFPDLFLSWKRLKNESTLVLLVDALSLPRVVLSPPPRHPLAPPRRRLGGDGLLVRQSWAVPISMGRYGSSECGYGGESAECGQWRCVYLASPSTEPSCWTRWAVEGTRLEKEARRRMSESAYLWEIGKVARSLGKCKSYGTTVGGTHFPVRRDTIAQTWPPDRLD